MKKFLLINWIICIIIIISTFISNRINNANKLDIIILIELNIYFYIDIIKVTLVNSKIESKIMYILVVILMLPIAILTYIFFMRLDLNRISNFIFMIFLFGIIRYTAFINKFPKYLTLKDK